MSANRTRVHDESGAEILEFAIVAPLLFLLALGTIYALLYTAAQLSLTHAASVGARYASLVTDAGTYPDPAAVSAKVTSSTPFFTPAACTTTVTGDVAANASVVLDVSCGFPNPLGHVLGSMAGSTSGAFATTLPVTARAEARRE